MCKLPCMVEAIGGLNLINQGYDTACYPISCRFIVINLHGYIKKNV